MVSPDRIEAPHANPTPNVPAFLLRHRTGRTKNDSVLVDRYSLSGKFDSFARFVEVAATHTFENCLVLGELDICLLHDLHAVSLRIPELLSLGKSLTPAFELPSDLLFIVHHEAKVVYGAAEPFILVVRH